MNEQFNFEDQLNALVVASKGKDLNKASKKKVPRKVQGERLPLLLDPVPNPCSGCPNEAKPKIIEGFGNPKGKLLIVAPLINVNDILNKRAFSDSINEKLFSELNSLGLKDNYYCVYLQRCGGELDEKASKYCQEYIFKELPDVEVILFLGLAGYNTLANQDRTSITQARYTIYNVLGKKALITYEPRTISNSQKLEKEFLFDLGRVSRLIHGTYGQDYKPQYFYPRTREEIVTALQFILDDIPNADEELVSADMESMYCKAFVKADALDPWSLNFRMWSIGYSWDKYKAIAFPFDPDPYLAEKFGLANVSKDPEVLELLDKIHRKSCVTHTQIDAFAVGKYGMKFHDLHDSLLVAYALNEEDQGMKDVDELSWRHTEEGGYKDKWESPETIEEFDWDNFMEYNCHDSDIERRIFQKLRDQAILEGVWDGYVLVNKPTNQAFIDFTCYGVDIDMEAHKRATEKFEKPLFSKLAEFRALPKVNELISFCKEKGKLKGKEFSKFRNVLTLDDINFTKDWQVEALLFDICGFKAPKTTDKGARAVDEEVVDALGKETSELAYIPKLIMEMRKPHKNLSTYVYPYTRAKTAENGKVERNPYIKIDGRVHPKFNLHKARTGRSSSEEPNFQNIIHDNDIRAQFIAHEFEVTGKMVRGLLIGGDYAQFEIRMAAHLSQDPVLIKALEFDVHSLNLAMQEKLIKGDEIFKMTHEREKELIQAIWIKYLKEISEDKFTSEIYDYPFEELLEAFSNGSPEEKTVVKKWKDLFKHRRTVAKESTFGPLYGMTVGAYAMTNNISIEDAEEVYAIDLATYKKKHEWAAEIKAKARIDNYVRSVFGKTRRLDYDKALRIPNQKFREKELMMLDRKAVNTPVQGPASDLNGLAAVKLNKLYKENGIQAGIIGPIHDSIMGDCEPSILEDVLRLKHHIMTTTPTEYLGESLVEFKVEVEYGKNWSDMKVFEI